MEFYTEHLEEAVLRYALRKEDLKNLIDAGDIEVK